MIGVARLAPLRRRPGQVARLSIASASAGVLAQVNPLSSPAPRSRRRRCPGSPVTTIWAPGWASIRSWAVISAASPDGVPAGQAGQVQDQPQRGDRLGQPGDRAAELAG